MTELRYLCLDAGLKVPRGPKDRTAANLHRKYRKSIAKYRNTVSLYGKYRIEISMSGMLA